MTGGVAAEKRRQLGYHCSLFCSSPSSPRHRLMRHPPYLVPATGYTTTSGCFKHLCRPCVSYSAYGGLIVTFFHLISSRIFTRRGCAVVVSASNWVYRAAAASYPLHGWLGNRIATNSSFPPLVCIIEDS